MKKKTRLTTILILAAVTAFALTGCSSSKKTEINLTNYVTVSFSGTDGAGTATVHYSDTQAANAVAEAMGVELTSSVSTEASIYMAVDDVNKSVTPNSGLSNGDVVTVSISMASDDWITDSMAKKVEFVGGSVDVTVEGLAEAVASEGEEESEEEGSYVDQMVAENPDYWVAETDENGTVTGYVFQSDAMPDEEALAYVEEFAADYPDFEWALTLYGTDEQITNSLKCMYAQNFNIELAYSTISKTMCGKNTIEDDDILEFLSEVVKQYPDLEWASTSYSENAAMKYFISYCVVRDCEVELFYEEFEMLFAE
ncbi:MAG: hypothetical protein LUH07_14270 [Lachnospiraceae bacterium]|nr:hypothetical protein [Lachnospiraceae bacterium]